MFCLDYFSLNIRCFSVAFLLLLWLDFCLSHTPLASLDQICWKTAVPSQFTIFHSQFTIQNGSHTPLANLGQICWETPVTSQFTIFHSQFTIQNGRYTPLANLDQICWETAVTATKGLVKTAVSTQLTILLDERPTIKQLYEPIVSYSSICAFSAFFS